ncbi:MAG: polysaccharide biosynthesis tyrosine autokinase [Planctomycetales bacterium]|nr:polysaccharide biosynthesis tyrosine autokinase [Planctomycetales bacterium]
MGTKKSTTGRRSSDGGGAFGFRRTDSTIDLLELFWRRRGWIIWFAVVFVALGAVYCSLAITMYESTADVLVVRKRPQAVTGDIHYESGFEDYLATHLAVIASPLIVERAISASNLASLECFADLEDPDEDLVDVIISDLEVEGGSRDLGESADSIMTLAYRCSVPEDCPIVVRALLDSYEAFHTEVYHGMSDNTVALIMQARDLLKTDLAEQEEFYSQFRQASPLVSKGTDEVDPLQDRLTTIEQQRSALLLREAEVRRQLLALDQAQRDGSDYDQLLTIVSELRQLSAATDGSSAVSTTLENQLIQLVDGEQRLLEHYGPNHPHVLTMRQRIADTRRFFILPTAAHVPDAGDQLVSGSSSAATDLVDVYRNYLQQELKYIEISKELLTDLYDQEHEVAKQHSIFQVKDESFQRNIERTEALYDVVLSRLQEASLVKDFGGFETRVIAPPRIGEKVSPSRRIILPASMFVGIVLGCLMSLVSEFWDGGFQSCEHVQQQLGIPVVGRIPQFRGSNNTDRVSEFCDAVPDPMLCAFYEPRSATSETFRSLRTSLILGDVDETSRVIQVTGPSPQDGASTVASNLAVSLAQTGKRVLLIDADLRRQQQQQLFGLAPAESGLAALIATDVEPEDVIRPTAVENLSLLPAGLLPDGACELFTSPRFGELLNLVRDSYDHVLIDTEPMLVSSDACVIASQTDGIVLTLSLTRDSRQRAISALGMLERVGANVLGIVVNRISGAMMKQCPMVHAEYASSDVNVHPSLRSEPEVVAG